MSNSNRTTNFGPLVSLTTTKADTTPPHLYLDSNTSFTAAGKVTLSGAITASGGLNVTSTMTLGANGFSFVGLRKSTISVDFPSVPGNDSVTTTATINALAAADVVAIVRPASIWSGSYYDLNVTAVASAASTLTLIAANSAATAVDPDAMNFDIYWLDLA